MTIAATASCGPAALHSITAAWTALTRPAGGTGTLYQLNGATNDGNTPLSRDFLTGGIFRDDQEIAVDTNGQTAVGSGSWSIIDGTSINFTIDLGGTNLPGGDEIGLHWGLYQRQ